MIPLRDSVRSRRFPLVTTLIIVGNALVFLYQLTLTREALVLFTLKWGFTPAMLFGPEGTTAPPPFGIPGLGAGGISPLVTLVTSTFLHGGWSHILFNMLFLWVFGDNVEDRLGKGRFVLFFLLAGVAGNLTHALAAPNADVPVIGASGAVAGVLGAYFLAFPRSRITSLVFLGIFVTIARVPAVVFLLLWFVIQLFSGLASIGAAGQVVAWWAHIGGFVAGAALFAILRSRRNPNPIRT
ncbi:MAG: rhomboid family intramembrane serine protease [Bacillota bacterium]|nr:MAG: rhomboid family intramembrane serine protease [Bacillota bacterium]